MKNFLAVFTREIKAYFASPIAYVVLIVFTLLSGLFFAVYFNFASRYGGEASMTVTFFNMSITMLFVVPLITMRLFAEEKRSGTIELLLTSPVTDTQVVMGKFFASLALFSIMLLLTFTCPILLNVYADPDITPIAVGYFGLFLLGSAFLSLGTVTSAITNNQIVAALIGFVALLVLWLIGWLSSVLGAQIGKVLYFISMREHFDDFAKGVLNTKHIIYYVSFTAFCLFLAVKMVQTSRWK